MTEVAVCGTGNYFAVNGPELVGTVTEGYDLRGADEGEVEGVEEKHEVFALVIRQTCLLEFTFVDGSAFEIRSGTGNAQLRRSGHHHRTTTET